MPNELTNPNNVVTEERLAQFYQQILPYMGGMPEIMMNRFPKGNIYNVDQEAIVGRWINGKPIYQKTVAYNNKKLYDDYTTLSLDTDPIETAIDGVIIFSVSNRGDYDGAMVQVNLYPTSDGSAVKVHETGTWDASASRSFYLTAWYTKIGDSAVEIGSDTDYSTTEKIVGTWIDGKPIWQKTVSVVKTASSSASTTLFTLSGVDTSIMASSFVIENNTKYMLPDSGCRIQIDSSGNVIANTDSRTSFSNATWYITLQYTKTSS